MEKLKINIEAVGNMLEITPLKGIEDNSKYTIRIRGLKGINGEIFPDTIFNVTTEIAPLYCRLSDLKALTETYEVSENTLLLFIRNASEEADFISGGTADANDYAVKEFVKTKTVLDCLLRGCMDKAFSGGGTYTLGDATLQDPTNATAFKNIIGLLRDLLKKWEDAIRGYYNEGRVKPKATRFGLKSSSNSDVSQITVDTILNDITRTPPQWS